MKKLAMVILGSMVLGTMHAELVVTRVPTYQGGALKDFQAPAPTPTIADPMREIGSKVVKVDDSWFTINGVVEQVHPDVGVRIRGDDGYDFLVINFPYKVAEGDRVGDRLLVFKALPVGTYEYNTAMKSTRTIHKFDYGQIWTPPPLTPEQIAAQKKKDAAEKKLAEDHALKFNQELAAKGDPYGLLRMGERYRDGDGVKTNLALARIYLQRAANAGSLQASNELNNLH